MKHQIVIELKIKENNETKNSYYLVEYEYINFCNKEGYQTTKIYNIKDIYFYYSIDNENAYIQADTLEEALEIFEKNCFLLGQKIEGFKILD